MAIERVFYTAKVRTNGDREGASRSSDGHFDVRLAPPGSTDGTNPEQLFATAWSACHLSPKLVAGKGKIVLPPGAAVDAEVDLCPTGAKFSLQARINVSLLGLDREVARPPLGPIRL